MNSLRESDFAFLQRVIAAQRERPLHLDALAKATGISASLLSRTLRRLSDAGWVERHQESTPEGRMVYYAPRSVIQVRWTTPAGTALEWVTSGDVDWQFPLVTQLQDADARSALVSLFYRLREAGLLDARKGSPAGAKSSPTNSRWSGLSVIAYGSIARGDARPGSDIDLVIAHGGEGDQAKAETRIRDIVADVNLGSARPMQAVVNNLTELVLPPWIRRAIQTEGVVVHDGVRDTRRGEAQDIWSLVYGKR